MSLSLLLLSFGRFGSLGSLFGLFLFVLLLGRILLVHEVLLHMRFKSLQLLDLLLVQLVVCLQL